MNNAGNTTSCPLVGIHSYHEGGAYKDNPKNRTANEPKRTESLFITTPLSSFVELQSFVLSRDFGERIFRRW